MKQRIRAILAVLIIAATASAFVFYMRGHPETVSQLRQLAPATVLVLLVLYAISFWAYAMVTRASLHMYKKTISGQENFLFNAYSSLVNFFGPGQSGPIFRGAYLKKRHNLGIKQFMFTTLLYLGFFAIISVLLMAVGSLAWWQTVLLLLAVALGSALFIWQYRRRGHITTGPGFNLLNIVWMVGAMLLQTTSLVVIYGIELAQVGAGASLGQVVTYTGVSNLALFVAITPGAIGIREAFLVFSQNLHHISTSSIVAANIVDRGVYLLFLGLLFILVLTMHAKTKLGVTELPKNQG